MTKWDKGLIIVLMIVSAALIFPILGGSPQAETASVKVKNEEVLRIPMTEDKDYSVDGTLGPVNIEVKDGRLRVTQENSPHHYCSKQGWVSDPKIPVVCLPNETVIQIEGSSDEDTVIQ